jgi:glutathione peroxidase
MTGKVDVNGAEAHPVFRQLTEAPDAAGEAGPVQWNFEKWLVAPDGAVAARFRPSVAPDAPEVRSAVEALLPR